MKIFIFGAWYGENWTCSMHIRDIIGCNVENFHFFARLENVNEFLNLYPPKTIIVRRIHSKVLNSLNFPQDFVFCQRKSRNKRRPNRTLLTFTFLYRVLNSFGQSNKIRSEKILFMELEPGFGSNFRVRLRLFQIFRVLIFQIFRFGFGSFIFPGFGSSGNPRVWVLLFIIFRHYVQFN